MGVKPTETPDENLLEKKPTDQKKDTRGLGGFFRSRRAEPPQDNTTKPDHQIPNKPTTTLKNYVADLQRKNACKIAPIKLDMEHLPAFLAVNTESIVKLDVNLEYQPDNNKWDRDYFQVLCDFFYYWGDVVDLKKSEFSRFVMEKIWLFEKFFPLPQKYALFVDRLAMISNEWYKDNAFAKYDMFRLLLELASLYKKEKHTDIFKTPSGFLSFLKDKGLPRRLFWPDKNKIAIAIKYSPFEKKLAEFLKNTNKPEDLQDIENKIGALAESSLNKNSISGEKSFFDAMKNEINKHKDLTKEDMREIGGLWRKIRGKIIGNGLSVKASRITVNGNVVPEQCIPAVEEFLGSVVKGDEIFLLGEWDSAKLPQDSKIRQDLVVAAILNLMDYYSYHNKRGYFNNNWISNHNNLWDAFGQLTEQERMAVVCREVRCGEKSFPLLPLILLDCKGPMVSDFIEIVGNFVPRIFDIKFQVKGEEKKCDIIELLEKIDALYNKPRDKNISEKESAAYFSLGSLSSALRALRRVRDIVNDPSWQENKAQELQKSKEEPSTSMHQAEREKLERRQQIEVLL